MTPPAPSLQAIPGGRSTPPLPDVSVVVPAFNESASIELLANRVRDVLERAELRFELIVIDDGSLDGTWEILRRLHRDDPRIRARSFAERRGKSSALSLGFSLAEAPIVVTMDADLQDLPEELPVMIEALKSQDLALVQAWRCRRDDPPHKVLASRIFNVCCSLASGLRLRDANCGFKAMRQDVAQSLQLGRDMHRFIPLFVHRSGGRVGEQPVRHARRAFGRSKYGLMRYFHGLVGLLRVALLPRLLGHAHALPAPSENQLEGSPLRGSLG